MDRTKCQWFEMYIFGKSKDEYECSCVGNRFETRKTVPAICPYCGKETETISENE